MPVRILGIGSAESWKHADDMCAGRDLPWLQDTDEADWWHRDGIEYRDVVVRDPAGEVFGVLNLTDANLADADNYDAMVTMLRDAAGPAGGDD